MGAPILASMRRRSNKAAVSPPPPPPSARTSSWLRPLSKNNARSESAEGGAAIGGVGGGQPAGCPKSKRAMSLNITPDTESESMQVMIVPQSPYTQKKDLKTVEEEDRCIYTVGSAEYLVKHSLSGDSQTEYFDTASPTNTAGREGSEETVKKTANVNDFNEAIAAGGGGSEKKKKNRFGFKLSPKKGKDSSDEQQGENNNNSNNNDQNGDKDDPKENGEDEKRDSSSNNGGPNRPGDSVTFSPERIQFANESTLPLHPGSESTAPTLHPSWTPVDGTEFKVRAGPNYAKHNKKEPSLASLYEVYCVRYFRSQKRTVAGATRVMPLPKMGARDIVKEGCNGTDTRLEEEKKMSELKVDEDTPVSPGGVGHHHPELRDTAVPDVLVVHFMLPYETPNVFKQKEDSPGGECVYYLRPSQRFLDEISGRKPATPATLLFKRWCAECRGDFKMRSRFKCMALVRNMDKHNFGLLKTYNGKPVLITESGRVGSGYQGNVKYLEMTANVHRWAFVAKKGFVSLIPKFANMQMEVGFTIEAHNDAEMPECMLGSTVLSYIGEGTGPMITPEMQEPVHEHQS